VQDDQQAVMVMQDQQQDPLSLLRLHAKDQLRQQKQSLRQWQQQSTALEAPRGLH
jgi:hypothetical protein